MRMWRNWQTRMIQVHVGNHAGSSPVIRTTKGSLRVANKKSEKRLTLFHCSVLLRLSLFALKRTV